MLAFRDEEALIAVIAIITVGVILLKQISAGAKERDGKRRLLEVALQHPHLDAATRADLLHQMTQPGLIGSWLRPRTLASIGWIGMFVGLGCWASGDRDAEQAGPIIALIAFGVVSLPFALRELDTRHHARRNEA